MPDLAFRLLGPFDARRDGLPLNHFRTSKVQALLAYLLVESRAGHQREALMTMLWPDVSPESGQTNLRQLVYQLRKTIPDAPGPQGHGRVPFILTDRQSIRVNPDAVYSFDVADFTNLVSAVRVHQHSDVLTCPTCQDRLEQLAGLYRGEFLAGFYLEDSNEFEAWAARRREVFRHAINDALHTLAAAAFLRGDYDRAQSLAHRQLDLDSLDERAYRQLMEAMARTGQRTGALAVFEGAARVLFEELGVRPSARTTRLAEQIQRDELGVERPIPAVVRGYKLLEEIGAGAFGVVHRAFQPGANREVAVKIINERYANHPDFVRRFEAEAQTIARLEHPHIVPLYDFWREPDNAYLVMRWLRGGNLAALLARGPLLPDRAAGLIAQLSAALFAAHRRRVIHGDVKPANILLDEDGNAYLSDFSVARDVFAPRLPIDPAGMMEYATPEQVLREELSPQTDQYSLGLVIYQMLTGRPPFPSDSPEEIQRRILEEALPPVATQVLGLTPDVDAIIRRATARDPRDRFEDVTTLAVALQRALHAGVPEIGQLKGPAILEQSRVFPNPYMGLRAFQETDASGFFGREALTAQLLAKLAGPGEDRQLTRFVAVVGPSGSGKSSAVKAGLIPALRAGGVEGSAAWFVAEMTPGSHPIEELERALWHVVVDPPVDLLEELQSDERGLDSALRRLLPQEPGDEPPQLMLVIDQFEELFTLAGDDVREQFIRSILAALAVPDSRLRVVATLRADFYDRPLQIAGLGELIRQGTEVILPLSPAELERSIARPAALAGAQLEPGLLAAMLADVADQPGSLPLLQFALTELYERREAGQLTLAAYRAINGVAGALGRRADEIYDSLDPDGRETARQLFLRLVTLGEGIEDTRRRVLRSELEALILPGDGSQAADREFRAGENDTSEVARRPSSVAALLDSFGRYRLLTFDRDPLTRGPTVEVAHEALLQEWPRLRGWLDESRADVRLQRLLAGETAAWLAASKGVGYLLRGSRLDQFEGWSDTPPVSLTADERAFLAASWEGRRRRQSEEETRRRRELDTARQLAETERRRAEEQAGANARLRRRAALLAGALALAGLLAVAAVVFARSSSQNATVAATRAAESNANAAIAVENANLAATRQAEAVVEANQRATAEAEANTQRDTALSREREALESYSLSLAANARQALDGGDQPLALLLALAANTVENPPLEAWRTLLDVAYAPGAMRQTQTGSPVNAVDISPDGQSMATGSDDGLIRLWDVNSGDLLATLAGHANAVATVVFSPDGTRLLSGGWDHKAILWDVASGTIERVLIGHGNIVRGAAFTRDGRLALTGENSLQLPGELILWDLDTGEVAGRFGGDLEETIEGVLSIAVTPDGRTALVGYNKESAFDTHTAALWDIETGEVIHFLEAEGQAVNSVAISPDGRHGFGASNSANIYIWELDSGDLVQTLRGHEGNVTSVAVSPDGLSALSGALDGEIILWDLGTGEPVEHFANHGDAVWGIGFLDNGRAVSGSADSSLQWWDLTGRWRTARWRDPDLPADHLVGKLELSPDGRTFLTATWQRGTGLDPALTVWDYESGTPRQRLDSFESLINDMVITDDNRQAVTAHNDGTIVVWDLVTGRSVRQITGHAGFVQAVDVSSDGRFAVTAGIDDQVIYQDLMTGEIIRRMTGHYEGRGILDIVFLPGDRHAVTSSWDGSLIVWDLAAGEQIHRLTGLTGGVGGHLFAPGVRGVGVNEIVAAGNQHVLSAGNDRTLLLWDVVTGDSVIRLTGHSSPVASVGLTPDGRRALSGAFDDSMILWDMATGEPIRRFSFGSSQGGGFFPSITIHPSGQTALTDDVDGSIIKWQLAEPGSEELIGWISDNRTLRELTCLERETFRIEPLCVGDSATASSADLLADARRASGTLVLAPAPSRIIPAGDGPTNLAAPVRVPQLASLGENRGELVRGNFDVWLYEGTAGEILNLKMVADQPLTDQTTPLDARFEAGVLDTLLYIINPDGSILQRIDDELTPTLERYSDAHLTAVKLPVDGQYRIEARSSLDDHAGGYTLRIDQREAIWDAELFAEYAGHYMEGPWQYETFIWVDGDRLMQSFEYYGAGGFENIAISESGFISAVDSALTEFTRDENGQVDGYRVLLGWFHPVGGQWYEAVRLGDLPPEFLQALEPNQP